MNTPSPDMLELMEKSMRLPPRVRDMLADLSKQIASDQMDWLDAQMKQLLPAQVYDQATRLLKQDKADQVQKLLEKNQLVIHFFRNSPMIRITRYGKLVSEFKPVINIDGRPVDIGKLLDQQRPDHDIWADDN